MIFTINIIQQCTRENDFLSRPATEFLIQHRGRVLTGQSGIAIFSLDS